mmetsp:Transcript_39791/g.97795  ORF Transcript_39791/g.97795 Transcript_39791/m.97795 type:complete len:229 (-) Transcript_39791:518-1204(-)
MTMCLNVQGLAQPFVSQKVEYFENFTIFGLMVYALAGIIFYVAVFPETQGHVCSGAPVTEICEPYLYFKNIISIFLVSWFLFTTCVGVLLTFKNIMMARSSRMVASTINKYAEEVEKTLVSMRSESEKDLESMVTGKNPVHLEEVLFSPVLRRWARELKHNPSAQSESSGVGEPGPASPWRSEEDLMRESAATCFMKVRKDFTKISDMRHICLPGVSLVMGSLATCQA